MRRLAFRTALYHEVDNLFTDWPTNLGPRPDSFLLLQQFAVKCNVKTHGACLISLGIIVDEKDLM